MTKPQTPDSLESIVIESIAKIDELARQVANLQSTPTTPTIESGIILPYGGATAPSGYLACDGTAVSRTTYADLYDAIGTTWGTGDGSTTFNLPPPDRVFLGKGTHALGSTGGAETIALVTAELPSHSHSFSATTDNPGNHTHSATYAQQTNTTQTGGGTRVTGMATTGLAVNITTTGAGGHTHSVSGTSGTAGSGTAHSNMQPWAAVNYIIKT